MPEKKTLVNDSIAFIFCLNNLPAVKGEYCMLLDKLAYCKTRRILPSWHCEQ